MALNDLTINQMVALTAPLVNEAALKKQFLSVPEVAGLHKQVVRAHEAVLKVRPSDAINDPVLRKIGEDQRPLDYTHDRSARALALGLEAAREWALAQDPPDEARAQDCDQAFSALFPDGVGVINTSFLAEAGHAQRNATLLADKALGEPVKATLKSILIRKGQTLLDVAEAWIASGKALGQLEAKRAARLAELHVGPAPEQRVVQNARSLWIATVALLTQTLGMAEASDAVKAALAHPFTDAAEKAGRRAAKKASPGDKASSGDEADIGSSKAPAAPVQDAPA